MRSPRRRPSPLWKLWILLVAVLAASSVIAGTAVAAQADSPAQLSASYAMTFDNLTFNETADGSLTQMSVDAQGDVTGFMTVDPPLGGTGSLTGTYTNGTLSFSVGGGDYTGTVDAQGNFSGTYVYASVNQNGTWQATPDGVAPVFTADTPPASAPLGTAFTYTFAASGQPEPVYNLLTGTLPAGLSLDALTGVLSGTPSAPGTYSFTLSASNGVSPDAVTPTITITVGCAGTPSTAGAALAQNLLSSAAVDKSGRLVQQDLTDAAAGQVATAGKPLSATLLCLLVQLSHSHSYRISALESGGTGHSGKESLHYKGDAADISVVDGQKLTGQNAPTLTVVSTLAPLMPAGSKFGLYLKVQPKSKLRCPAPLKKTPALVTLLDGVTTFGDTCDHIHVQVPKGTA